MRAALLTTFLTLALPSAASAVYFTGTPVDSGPGIRLGDLDVAHDGTGAVVYVKQDGGVDHVFASRLVNGAFQPPERLDGPLAGAGPQPTVAVADGGRVTAVFVNGGNVYATTRQANGTAFTQPQQIGSGSGPSVDMSISGVAYASYTNGGNVQVARLGRGQTQYANIPGTLDLNASNVAGEGANRSHISTSADGSAIVVWGENGRIGARRVYSDHIAGSPIDITADSLDGHAGGPADSPWVDVEDDSSFAWAVFRQRLDDGRWHTIAKRLVGSLFEQPTLVDGLGFGGDESATPFVDLNGRGEGMALTGSGALGAYSSLLHDDHFFNAQLLNQANNVPPQPVGGMAENNDAHVAWLQGTGPGDATVHIVSYDIDPAKRTVPPPGPDTVLTTPDAGAVDGAAGIDMGVNRAGDAVVVFMQGSGDARRLMSAGFDREPGSFRTYTSAKFRKFARPSLSWAPSFDLWGPITYHIEIDGQPFGDTQDTKLTPLNRVPDGEHKWRVVATDRRGQSAATPLRTLRVDATKPTVRLTVHRKGRLVRASVKATDLVNKAVKASGVRVVRIDFGDGFRVTGRKAAHRYGRGGRRTVRAIVADQAGNVTVVRKRIRV